jgi:hypothetical protein
MRLRLGLPRPDKPRLRLLHASEFRGPDGRAHCGRGPDAVAQYVSGDLLPPSTSSRPCATYRSLTLTLNDALRHRSHLALDVHVPSLLKAAGISSRADVAVQRGRHFGRAGKTRQPAQLNPCRATTAAAASSARWLGDPGDVLGCRD